MRRKLARDPASWHSQWPLWQSQSPKRYLPILTESLSPVLNNINLISNTLGRITIGDNQAGVSNFTVCFCCNLNTVATSGLTVVNNLRVLIYMKMALKVWVRSESDSRRKLQLIWGANYYTGKPGMTGTWEKSHNSWFSSPETQPTSSISHWVWGGQLGRV